MILICLCLYSWLYSTLYCTTTNTIHSPISCSCLPHWVHDCMQLLVCMIWYGCRVTTCSSPSPQSTVHSPSPLSTLQTLHSTLHPPLYDSMMLSFYLLHTTYYYILLSWGPTSCLIDAAPANVKWRSDLLKFLQTGIPNPANYLASSRLFSHGARAQHPPARIFSSARVP